MKWLVQSAAIAAAVIGFVGWSVEPASAVTFNVSGLSSSNTTATVDFVYDPALAKITIGILNTTSASTDPRITGFAFNAPTNVTGISSFMASGTANNGDWDAVFNANSIDSPANLGRFDVGGLTGSNLNGGTANSGILLNTTGMFMFTLTGSNLHTLTETSFLSLLSDPQNAQSVTHPFVVRFQRLNHDGIGSDVAVPDAAIPLPASLPLLLAGLTGLGFLGRKRKAA